MLRRQGRSRRLRIPTIATVPWTIDQMLRPMMPDQAVTEWSNSTGHLHLVEQRLPRQWAGRRLPPEVLRGEGIRVAAVTPAGVPALDVEDLIAQEGDVLSLIVTCKVEEELVALFPGVSIVPGTKHREVQP